MGQNYDVAKRKIIEQFPKFTYFIDSQKRKGIKSVSGNIVAKIPDDTNQCLNLESKVLTSNSNHYKAIFVNLLCIFIFESVNINIPPNLY